MAVHALHSFTVDAPRSSPARDGLVRHLLAIGALACILLTLLNVPFYSGASIGSHFHWRMEHGRITLRASSVSFHENFYVAINSEPLRWFPEGRYSRWNDWDVAVPLWIPSVLCGAWWFAGFRRH